MNILHVYKDYHPVIGGIENHVRTLAELQAAAGHQVTVLVTNPGGQLPGERLHGVDVVRLPRIATVASTPLSAGFPGAIRRLMPDMTHLHFPYPVGEIGQLLGGRSAPFVITYHSDVVRQRAILSLYRPLLNRVLDLADRILPTSDRYVDSSPFLRPRREKCTVVGLSVDPAPFAAAAPLLPPTAVPTLLFLGRHRYYKGVGQLLEAVAGLPVRLLIGGDGPMRATWEGKAAALGLGERALFLGEVPDVELPGLYASADVFVLPSISRAEAFGIVLLEAMASGLPCVTTELGTGTSYVVQDGVTGRVVPPEDPASLRIAIEGLLQDGALRKKMGAAGRARVLAEFTPQILYERVMRVYAEILDTRLHRSVKKGTP